MLSRYVFIQLKYWDKYEENNQGRIPKKNGIFNSSSDPSQLGREMNKTICYSVQLDLLLMFFELQLKDLSSRVVSSDIRMGGWGVLD